MSPLTDAEPWCLVLSGGGAKGVFHLGVWRALQELGVPVGGFVGNSIGALVAAFLAGGKEAELSAIAKTISVEAVVELPPPPGTLLQWWKYFVDHGGLNTGPMRRLLEQNVDEAAIRARGADLGIVTVNVSDLKPCELFLEEMAPGSLIDYLMASSAFPGFASPRIQGKHYVDGGLWDNLPYELARRRGWKRIILVDVAGMGRNRRPELGGALTAFVRSSIEMGGPFDFDRNRLERYEALGYLETLRAFGQLQGRFCFLHPDPDREASVGSRLPLASDHSRNRLGALLEQAAEALEVERVRAWTYLELAAELNLRREREEALVRQIVATALSRSDRRPLLATLGAAIRHKALTATPYRTLRLIRELATGNSLALLEKTLMALHPELPATLTYFELAAPLLLE